MAQDGLPPAPVQPPTGPAPRTDRRAHRVRRRHRDILPATSIAAFTVLFVRDFLIRGLGRNLTGTLRSPRTGPAYATIPGAINVLAVAVSRV